MINGVPQGLILGIFYHINDLDINDKSIRRKFVVDTKSMVLRIAKKDVKGYSRIQIRWKLGWSIGI